MTEIVIDHPLRNIRLLYDAEHTQSTEEIQVIKDYVALHDQVWEQYLFLKSFRKALFVLVMRLHYNSYLTNTVFKELARIYKYYRQGMHRHDERCVHGLLSRLDKYKNELHALEEQYELLFNDIKARNQEYEDFWKAELKFQHFFSDVIQHQIKHIYSDVQVGFDLTVLDFDYRDFLKHYQQLAGDKDRCHGLMNKVLNGYEKAIEKIRLVVQYSQEINLTLDVYAHVFRKENQN